MTDPTSPPGYDWGNIQIPFTGTVTPGYVVAMKAYTNRHPPLAASGQDAAIGTITQWAEGREKFLQYAGWVVLRGQTVRELMDPEPDYILRDLKMGKARVLVLIDAHRSRITPPLI